MESLFVDPFSACESKGCNHDLNEGVLITDLLCCDGPHATRQVGDGGDVALALSAHLLPEAA